MTEDDEPQFLPETLKALQEFLQEQALAQNNVITEDWQLSQFWYDEATAATLSNAALSFDHVTSIALISCPTLYPAIKSKVQEEPISLVLFEYDKRFSKYDPDFVFYDYNEPLKFDSKLINFFDVILIDPPFLSEECLTKTSKTVEAIKKPNSKIILCTGAVMEELAEKLLRVKKCEFQPRHQNNLANEFICMTNFGEI